MRLLPAPEIGSAFVRWTVISDPVSLPYKGGGYKRYIPCRCVCGMEKNVLPADLLNGRSTSCGCLRVEIVREKSRTHGEASAATRTNLYKRWLSMRDRCTNPKSAGFRNYGGRGISVCSEWDDFVRFKAWAEESGYRPELEIDRVDTDGPYAPENCRWVTHAKNMNNKRNNFRVTAFGETKTIRTWEEDARCIVNYQTIYLRLQRGWGAELAITAPSGTSKPDRSFKRPRTKTLTAFGETKYFADWVDDPRCLVTEGILRTRIRDCWNPEDALVTPKGESRSDRKEVISAAAKSRRRKELAAFGERKQLIDWSNDPRCQVSAMLLRGRIHNGWDPERAISTPPRGK